MSFDGIVIDGDYDPIKDGIYDLFVIYFGNPSLTKIKEVESNSRYYSIYMCKMNALLGVEFRYLIATIEKDSEPTHYRKRLTELKWISLQTRTLTDDHDIPMHSYVPKKLPGLSKSIVLKGKDARHYMYSVEGLPLNLALLVKEKSKGGNDYHARGDIPTALETYQTIITFN
jgi:hypothetical protein